MNTSAQTSPKTSDSLQKQNALTSVGSGSMGKEQMGGSISPKEPVVPISAEVQPHKEVVEAGLEVHQEVISVPPDLSSLGVAPAGSSAPVTTTSVPQIVLPLTDQTIEKGLHVQVTSALRWLSEWCIRKLKKAHMTLKVVHGTVMRVPYKPYE